MARYMFGGNTGETPESVKRKRELAAKIMGQGPLVAPRSTLDGLGNAFDSIMGGVATRRMNKDADTADAAGQESASAAFGSILDAFNAKRTGGFPAAPNPGDSSSMATMPATDTASARVAQAHGGGSFNGDLRSGIIATAEAIGADPMDLATAISYETAGTFDPTKKGPRTQWGQHRGLIQFGEPQAKQHGVNWDDPIGSQLGPDGAIASYFKSSGFQPGMSGLDLYSTINAGAPGRYNRSDANNGGAPGTVQDKWEKQMAGHREKAMQLIGDYSPASAQAPQTESGLTPEALQQWAFSNYAPDVQNGAVDAVNALGDSQPVGVAENPQDILAQEQAMMGQDPLAFQQPDMMMPSQGTQPRLQAPMAAAQQPMPQPMPQAAPPLPDPRMVDDMPVAGIQPQQLAQAGGFPEMAGSNPQAIPAPGPDIGMLLQAASNPWLSEQQRGIVNMMLEQQMQSQDPMRQLDMDYKRAQIEKMGREAAGGGNDVYGTPIYGRDPETGQSVLGVIGKDGSFKRLDTDGVEITPGVTWQDFGTHRQAFDRSGAPVNTPVLRHGDIPAAHTQGQDGALSPMPGSPVDNDRRAELGKVEDNATAIISMVESLSKDPYLDNMVGPMAGRLPNVSADAARVQSKMDQIGGQAFLQAFETLRGGGTISNVEGEKAQAAIARLNVAQNPADYRAALDELKVIVRTSLERARRSAGGGSPSSSDGYRDKYGLE